MLDIPALQIAVYPLAVLYFLLHAGPLLRHRYEVSIRGGTDWRFFASEVALFTGYVVFAPAIVQSPVGRVALGVHLTLHVGFTITDYLAHDILLGTALTPRSRSAVLWFAKESGLAIDTATHAVAVTLLALALPLWATLGLLPVSLALFFVISDGYVRRHGAAAAG